jgi:HEAT repeat protein
MKLLIAAFLLLLVCVSRSDSAPTAQQWVETLRKAATPNDGIGKEEQKIAQQVRAAGPAAIPYLLWLLRDENEDVRELAAFTLRDIKGLTDEHLDALIESRRRNSGVISYAIARVGTPRAVKFLVEELLRERQTHSSVNGAIVFLGEKAVPELIRIYQTDEGWDTLLEYALYSIFKDLGKQGKGQTAIAPLLKIANDEGALPVRRARAIDALGALGLTAERAVPSLMKLQKAPYKAVREAADSAIVGIGTAEAVPILLKRIEQTPELFYKRLTVRSIGWLRSRGKSAGPALMKYLAADQDGEMRVAAAIALGCIGYREAADDLIKLLASEEDWRLAFAATAALQLLKAKEALPALEQTAKEYWYPPVRDAAARSAKVIRSGAATPLKNLTQYPFPEIFSYENAGDKMDRLEREDRAFLRFPLAAEQTQAVKVTVEGRDKALREEEWVGVEVPGGFIAGVNRGEWGGHIGFVDQTRKPVVFAYENTEAIYKTAQGIFAVTGLAHISFNDGIIFKVTKGADGAWKIEPWRALPGAPIFSCLLKDGSIFVSCYGGIVVVSPEGNMKSLTRSESLNDAGAR